ncbi:hypothetical protein IH799_08850 [candidate division KSB1 bacterium]|nr:hypothetical protein [candidate division KSB1 bacterium]
MLNIEKTKYGLVEKKSTDRKIESPLIDRQPKLATQNSTGNRKQDIKKPDLKKILETLISINEKVEKIYEMKHREERAAVAEIKFLESCL